MASVQIRKRVLVNPQRKKKAKRKASNPQLVLLGALNPTRRKTVKKAKKHSTAGKKRKQNPFRGSSRKTGRSRSKKRNPSITRQAGGFLQTMIVALLGAFVTRQAPQVALGPRNSGYLGYGANVVTALAAAALVGRFVNRAYAQPFLIGGAVFTGSRLISEMFTGPVRALALSGWGDPGAIQRGSRLRGLSGVEPAYFPTPPVYENGRPVIPQEIIEAARTAPTPASQLAGLRFGRG